jgi:hypothetical protein
MRLDLTSCNSDAANCTQIVSVQLVGRQWCRLSLGVKLEGCQRTVLSNKLGRRIYG